VLHRNARGCESLATRTKVLAVNARYTHHLALALSATFLFACTKDGDDSDTLLTLGNDGFDPTEDGDTTGDGDGDGDPTTGDGDGDPTTGDGDGDPTTGDGDGDPTTGDGDGDTGGGAACMGMEAPAGTPQVGQQVSHWGGGFTADGEAWDYCELAGTPFLLVISGAWCGPCNDLAAGMAGMPSSFTAQVEPIRAGLEAGTLEFVEVLLDNFNDFGATSVADLAAWENMYPNEFVYLLGDATPGTDGTEPLWIYLGPVHMGAVPSGILVDADFNIEVLGLDAALNTAGANYGG
jgi:hypothetical protein